MADLHIEFLQVRNYSFSPIILIIFIYICMHVLFNKYFHHVYTYISVSGWAHVDLWMSVSVCLDLTACAVCMLPACVSICLCVCSSCLTLSMSVYLSIQLSSFSQTACLFFVCLSVFR